MSVGKHRSRSIVEPLTISRQEARRFLLAHQGLWPPHGLAGKTGILAFVERAGCIQFDPLNIVGRNPDLVLQARIADYRVELLEELLYQDRRLLDGFDKNMSIYRREDWPYFRRRREAAKDGSGRSGAEVQSVLEKVRQTIAEQGPLSSLDLGIEGTVDWAWAPTRLARAALESMYFRGELVIHHKVNTRKVYDFAHRHLPEEVLSAPDPNQTEEQYHDWYVLRRIGSVGLLRNRSGDAWLGMSGIKSRERTAALARLIEQGKVVAVEVEGMDGPLYIRSADRLCLVQTLDNPAPSPRAAILAPLDNLLWDRQLVRELFGFDYIWEVYKPVAERRYGYYVLPILYGDRFVARFEPGWDKENGTLAIRNWWWEADGNPPVEMRSELQRCFGRFLRYLDTGALQIGEVAAEQAGLDWLDASR